MNPAWLDDLLACRDRGEAAVMVTVASVRGSAPREAGAKMIVTAATVLGTIGGGHLEYKAIAIARDQLAAGNSATVRRFPLGASLGQCCGGVVNLLFEAVPVAAPWRDALAEGLGRGLASVVVTAAHEQAAQGKLLVGADSVFGTLGAAGLDRRAIAAAREMAAGGPPTLGRFERDDGNASLLFLDPQVPQDFNLFVFGAGHVGRALVNSLAALPCRITWVDERAEAFPPTLPDNVTAVLSEDCEDEVDAAPAGAWFVVMTHEHGLDQRLAERILRRDDFSWFGLIGSHTKRRAFEQRLGARGIEAARLARMQCPIGVGGIRDKHPAAIAVAVAAQILLEREAREGASRPLQHSARA